LRPAPSFPSARSLREQGLDYVDEPRLLQESAVYFNSNQYHGNQFLADSAVMAGYINRGVKLDPSFLEKGVGVLVEQDTSNMIVSSENTLLRTLIQWAPSRTSVKTLLDARSALNSSAAIAWSSSEREWLFHILVDGSDRLPTALQSPVELREFLGQLEEAPNGAFRRPNSNDSQNDTSDQTHDIESDLDQFFDDGDEVSDDTRGDLQAQEALASLMLASAVQHAEKIQHELISSENILDNGLQQQQQPHQLQQPQPQQQQQQQLLLDQGESASSESMIQFPEIDNVDQGQLSEGAKVATTPLDAQSIELVRKLRDTNVAVRSLADSSKRIHANMVGQRDSTRFGGRNYLAFTADLASRLDEHLQSILNVTDPGSSIFADSEINDDEESSEDALKQMAEEWGEWYDDDYVWSCGGDQQRPPDRESSETVGFGRLLDQIADEGETESLEEALARMDTEWEGWDTDS
jgi:hypothetical protein